MSRPVACPKCQSDSIEVFKYPCLPHPVTTHRPSRHSVLRCRDCGYKWKTYRITSSLPKAAL